MAVSGLCQHMDRHSPAFLTCATGTVLLLIGAALLFAGVGAAGPPSQCHACSGYEYCHYQGYSGGCTAQVDYCEITEGKCGVECTSNSDCGAKEYCDTSTYSCTECPKSGPFCETYDGETWGSCYEWSGACGSYVECSDLCGDEAGETGSCSDGTCDTSGGGGSYCGDGTCNADESCSSCSTDCGSCSSCGDGTCDSGESCSSCSTDCGQCDTTAPSVVVNGDPASWSDDVETATVSCSDGGSGCDSSTYRTRTYDTDPGSCSTDYSSYGAEPRDISSHMWVCGAAKDNVGNTAYSALVEFTVDTASPTTTVTGPGSDTYYRDDIAVTVDDTESGDSGFDTCRYRVDDGNDGTFETGWITRSCPDGGFTVTVGSDGQCSVQGADRCHVQTDVTDRAGNRDVADATFDIDYTRPDAACDSCDTPDPVKSGERITFDPETADNVGLSAVRICHGTQTQPRCDASYCSGVPCRYATDEDTFTTRIFWVNATDRAGNSRVVGPFNFTVKKGIGATCRTDDACLIGRCVERRCRVGQLPPPEIYLITERLTTALPATGAEIRGMVDWLQVWE